MKLSAYSVIYKLKELNPVYFFYSLEDGKQEYTGIKQYDETSKKLSIDYIYVANVSDIYNNLAFLNKKLTFICINDKLLCEEDLKAMKVKMIVVDDGVSAPFLLNYILDVYEELTNWDKNMHIASLEGITSQNMVDISEKIIENPMIIFDSSFNVIAYTKNIKTDYKPFIETVRSGFTHSEIIEKVKRNKIFKQINESDEPIVEHSAESNEKTNIYIRISSEGTLLAYACIFCGEEKPEKGYIDIVKCFFRNLTLFFKQNFKEQRFGNLMYENFIAGLINNNDQEKEKVEEQLKYIDGISMEGPFLLCKFVFGYFENIPLPFIARELNNLMINAKPFIYNNELFALKKIKNESENFFNSIEKKNMQKVFLSYNYCCGVSDCFQKITDISIAYIQCEKAIHFGNKSEHLKNQIYNYREYYFNHMFEIINEKISIEYFQSKNYRILKEYDQKHKTDYMGILITYLENDNNATLTSKELYMHRNTIIYTIKKIEKLLKVDFDDFNIKKDFIISDQIEKYIKLFG